MSLSGDPSKTEVMGWSPVNLANYMGKLKLSRCDKLVLKQSISGAQFMEMTVSDLLVFPSLYVPLVAKIQSDIKKRYQKQAIGDESEATKNRKQDHLWAVCACVCVWQDNGGDNDSKDGEESLYICALTEPQDNKDTYKVAIKSFPSADTRKAPQRPREATLQDGLCRGDTKRPKYLFTAYSFCVLSIFRTYIKLLKLLDPCVRADSVHLGGPAERASKPPVPCPKKTLPPPTPFRAPAGPPALHNERSEDGKPSRPCGPSKAELPKSKSNNVQANVSSKSSSPKQKVPKPTNVPNREGQVPQVPQPAEVKNSKPRQSMALDLSWYQGKVTRLQAEAALRQVNKDGAFLVRDSSHGTNEHPYTLMLLKEGKVYNIMIRRQGNSYTLGSGLKRTGSFTGVKEMIDHHTNTPLVLLEYMGSSTGLQNWCCLKHPVGLTVTMGGGEAL
ncbi:lymphocyte cytosolic protein 2 [Spinachia spinachia]